MENTSIVIAIDGTSASGKGTIARRLAEHLGFAYLDTGLLYRAVGHLGATAKINLEDKESVVAFIEKLDVNEITAKLNDPVLRGGEAGNAASKVATVQQVRDKLLNYQKDFASNPPNEAKGAVLDGRDIGTVIAPDAKVKIYVTADQAVRARRRWKELRERNETVTYDAVLADLKSRDERDQTRSVVPALPAADAVHLDNSGLTVDAAFEAALTIVQSKISV